VSGARRLAVNLGLLLTVGVATTVLLFLFAAVTDGETFEYVPLGALWGAFFALYALPVVLATLLVLELAARGGAEPGLLRALVVAGALLACGVL
jgi:hypothetical protein